MYLPSNWTIYFVAFFVVPYNVYCYNCAYNWYSDHNCISLYCIFQALWYCLFVWNFTSFCRNVFLVGHKNRGIMLVWVCNLQTLGKSVIFAWWRGGLYFVIYTDGGRVFFTSVIWFGGKRWVLLSQILHVSDES